MRLRLSLTPLNPKTAVPINYNYPLSAALYKVLSRAAPDYASWLHENGYRSPADRLLKLFTFSRLNIPRVAVLGKTLVAGDERPWLLQLTSPVEEDFVQNFVLGLFQNQKLEIGGKGAVGRFLIDLVEALPVPAFTATTRFKTLSSIVVSTMREHRGRLQSYYYRPNDPELSDAIQQNLLHKYEIMHGQPPVVDTLEFRLDESYLKRKGGPEKIARLIVIKEGTREETCIKSFDCPFTLSGNPELMHTAWECGLGDHNSMGFGMVEVVEASKGYRNNWKIK